MKTETVYLEQGSPEWHEHRATHFNASEAGSVMSCAPWKPRNMAELLALKRGEFQVFQNAAMSRGNDLEPVARSLAEEELGRTFTPTTMTRGRYSASLDGLCFEGRHAIEIKCPTKADSDLFAIRQSLELKSVAPHYWYQLVHQAWVSGVDSIAFCVYHPDRDIHIGEVTRDELAADFDTLLSQWEIFGKHLDDGTSPEVERNDDEWESAVMAYRAAKMLADQYAAQVDDAKKRLTSLGGGRGFGLSVSRVAGKKTTEYAKAIKALLPDADLTPWQKVGEPSWSVREIKGA